MPDVKPKFPIIKRTGLIKVWALIGLMTAGLWYVFSDTYPTISPLHLIFAIVLYSVFFFLFIKNKNHTAMYQFDRNKLILYPFRWHGLTANKSIHIRIDIDGRDRLQVRKVDHTGQYGIKVKTDYRCYLVTDKVPEKSESFLLKAFKNEDDAFDYANNMAELLDLKIEFTR